MKVIYDSVKDAYVVVLLAEENVTCINARDIVEVRKEFIDRMTWLFNEAVIDGLTRKD